MDKVKQIFKSDSHDADTVRSNTDGTTVRDTVGTSASGTHSGTHNDTLGSGSTGGGVPHSSGTQSGIANAEHRHAEPASLTGHKHNIEKHHNVGPDDNATHNHQHLAAVTKEGHHTHETEEVQRIREHDRHVHHVQHHVQPVLDTKHHDREHTEHTHAPTQIKEQHVSTDEDRKLFAGLNTHKDSQHDAGTDRKIVDKGEIVNENVSHHVHHVVQPVIERDTHHHKTIHTSIPVHHTTHEAPIVHQSTTHDPVHLKDFVSQGGDLKSKLTHDKAGVLADGECSRDVDGPAEKLAQKLHLGGSHSQSTTAGQTGTTGTAGTAL